MKSLLTHILAIFLFLFCIPVSSLAGATKDGTNTAVSDTAATIKVAKVVYTLESVAGEDVTLTLPSYGVLDRVAVEIPTSDPPDTGFTVELYSTTATTKFDRFEGAGAELVTTENKDLYPTYNGNRVNLSLVGGGYYLTAKDLGAGNTLTVILWLWL